MRKAIAGALFLLVSIAGVGVSTAADDAIVATLKKFNDTFNAGDMAGAAATHASTPDLTIVDEVAPFMWQGTNAFSEWAAALDADSKKKGITDAKVAIGAPTRVETSGDTAYVIVPAVYRFKQNGAAMRADAQMTFMLKKAGANWLIHSWVWTGPKAKRAGASE